MFFPEEKSLIVVYKDEMLVNLIKKLVVASDDKSDKTAAEAEDYPIRIVSWSEKMWLAQKKAGNISSKILFLGDIKGHDKLTPVIDILFEEYGIKYGCAGSQAIIFADPAYFKDKSVYDAFLAEVCTLPVPNIIKTDYLASTPIQEELTGFKRVLSGVRAKVADTAQDIFLRKAKIRQQMLAYGIIRFCSNHLKSFLDV